MSSLKDIPKSDSAKKIFAKVGNAIIDKLDAEELRTIAHFWDAKKFYAKAEFAIIDKLNENQLRVLTHL